MVITSKDIIAIIGALAWPTVLLLFLVMFRKSIRELIKRPGALLKTLGLPGGISIEFAQLKGSEIGWSTLSLPDVPLLSPVTELFFPSTPENLVKQFGDYSPLDYAIIDLGMGKSWITSRLYIFALMLQRMRGLRYFVFVTTTTPGVRRRFVGITEASNVRWALAGLYPRLEEAFGKAYANLESTENYQAVTRNGALKAPAALTLVTKYLVEIRVGEKGSDPNPKEEWIYFEKDKFWEYARWLVDIPGSSPNTVDIERIFAKDLNRSYIRTTDLWGKSRADQAKFVISREGPYVAVVNEDRGFEKLIDRQVLMERVTVNLIDDV